MAIGNGGCLREFLDRIINEPQIMEPICLRFVNKNINVGGQSGESFMFIVNPDLEPISESGFEPDVRITYGSEWVSRIHLEIISDQDALPENLCHVCDQPFRHCDCEPNLEWETQFNTGDGIKKSG